MQDFNNDIIHFPKGKDMSFLADFCLSDRKRSAIVLLYISKLNNLHCVPALWLQFFAGAGIRKSGESPEQ